MDYIDFCNCTADIVGPDNTCDDSGVTDEDSKFCDCTLGTSLTNDQCKARSQVLTLENLAIIGDAAIVTGTGALALNFFTLAGIHYYHHYDYVKYDAGDD